MTKLKTSLTFLIFYYFTKKFYHHHLPTKKPPDWVTSLGDYDEKKF